MITRRSFITGLGLFLVPKSLAKLAEAVQPNRFLVPKPEHFTQDVIPVTPHMGRDRFPMPKAFEIDTVSTCDWCDSTNCLMENGKFICYDCGAEGEFQVSWTFEKTNPQIDWEEFVKKIDLQETFKKLLEDHYKYGEVFEFQQGIDPEK